jgi:hypothetical protein
VQLGLFLSVQSDNIHRVTINKNSCSVNEEFLVDVQTLNGEEVWFIEAKAFKTVMTAESDKTVTANRSWKREWERFFPQKAAELEEKLPETISLKSNSGSFLCAKTFKELDVSSSKEICANL